VNESSTGTETVPLSFPPPVAPASPTPFPWVASVAPVIASAAIWAITGSVFALVFAGLSPVIAIAGVVDGRRHSRSARRRAALARRAALEQLEREIADRQHHLRLERIQRLPGAANIIGGVARSGEWNGDDGPPMIRLGVGTAASGIRISGEAVDERERRLRRSAAALESSPVEADATGGIGIVGTPLLARALARGYLLQLVHAFSPDALGIARLPADGWEWARMLPHATVLDARTVVEIREAAPTEDSPAGRPAPERTAVATVVSAPRRAVIAIAASVEELPAACAVVVNLHGPGVASATGRRLPAGDGRIEPELVLEVAAARAAGRLARRAAVTGLVRQDGSIPARIAWSELSSALLSHVSSASGPGGNTLAAVVGAGANGPLTLDIVNDGPHAVVGGTTGSGKSELLVTWVAAICARYRPSAVGVLLVDFKGGSAFGPLAALPHCVGIVTDLAQGEAERVLGSLKAELRHRERALAALGVRSIGESGGKLARLVIVVDEFATMLDTLPDLHALFVDIAARGRSLGVHIILCTQRPAGVVRDSLLANCTLRVSLRVNNPQDSIVVVGTDAAARISAATPGRCIVARDDGVNSAQIAEVGETDVWMIAHESGGEACRPARRPWLDPLPARIPLESLQLPDGADAVLGVTDEPDEQRQSVAAIGAADPHLLVIGTHGSGKSTFAQSIARQLKPAAVFEPRTLEHVWDALCAAAEASDPTERSGRGRVTRTLILDDLDAQLARMPDEYQSGAVERLVRIARDGPAAGIRIVATVHRITPALRSCAALLGDPLLLRQANRQEYVLAGGPAALHDDRLGPGGGVWRGHRIQLAVCGTERPAGLPEAEDPHALALGRRSTILVTRSSRSRREQLSRALGAEIVDVESLALTRLAPDAGSLLVGDGASGSRPRVFVAEPDVWQSHWPLFVSLRTNCRVVFDACTVADLRALLHTRDLPPLCAGADRVWELTGSGRLRRACLIGPDRDAAAA
jgi:S-DNA-T family DNA segregation ATPase FtsK/SpoIIIE